MDNDSIIFAAKHYNPDGGPMALKLVKNSGNPAAVSVMMDGKVYNSNNNNNNNNNSALSVKMLDPKTVHIDLFVPPGDHSLQTKGIRNIPV